MKLHLPLLLLALALTSHCQLVDTSSELICPDDNPAHCYPKIFVPSDEWQVIKEGQDIPVGLHVRMNIETGEREAKLNEETGQTAPELIVVEQPETPHDQAEKDREQVEQQIQDTINKYRNEKKLFLRSRVSEAELNDFQSSVDELLTFGEGGDLARLEKALETLADLSHDIEFGVRLTKDPAIYAALSKVAEVAVDEESVVERAYRIMGSALRNNPEAVDNVISGQPELFVSELFVILKLPDTTDVIQKRILGVISALSSNRSFAYQYLNIDEEAKSQGLDLLIKYFPQAGRASKERIINILEDLEIIEDTPSYDRRSLEMSVKPEYKVSKLLQARFVGEKLQSEPQFTAYFLTLVDLHENNVLDVSKEFLLWLSEESELRKLGKRARDHVYSGENPDFDKLLVDVRHRVFGNPHGHRKAYDDEL